MSVSRRIVMAAAVGWLGKFIGLALNFALMRALFQKLDREQVELWILFGGGSLPLLFVLDLGMSVTFMRRVALARGKSGVASNAPLTEESRGELADLIASGRIVFRSLALAASLIMFLGGLFFLQQLPPKRIDYTTLVLAWAAISLGNGLGVSASLWNSLLGGLGFMGWRTAAATAFLIPTTLLQIAWVWCGGELTGLAAIFAVSGLLNYCGLRAAARQMQPELFAKSGRWNSLQVRSMVSPALLCWLTSLGGFLILKTDQYIISYFRGTAEVPDYFVAYELVFTLFVAATSFAGISSVFVSQLWQAGNYRQIHVLLRRNLRAGLFMMVCGVACLSVAGQNIMALWLPNGHFVGNNVLFTFCFMLTLEAQHSIVAYFSRATEDEVYAPWALAAGLLNITFGLLLIGPLGLWGVALGTALAQLLTNNWYVVYRGLWRFKLSLWEHISTVVIPVLTVFVFALAGTWFAADCFTTDLGKAFAACAVSGLVLAVSCWYGVLDSEHRLRVRLSIRSSQMFLNS